MSKVTFKGNPVQVAGDFVKVGEKAPEFCLCGVDLSPVRSSDFLGKKVVLNIFPSIDTPTCAESVRQFNQRAASKSDVVVLCVSADLPFAAKRFCEAEGISGVQSASFFRSLEFPETYGVKIADGALRGLATRAVICLDGQGTVLHSELVSEIADEPNYEAALAVL